MISGELIFQELIGLSRSKMKNTVEKKMILVNSCTKIIPEDEHIKWYLYELYRDLKNEKKGGNGWSKKNGQLQKEPKTILGKLITPILEKNNFGFDIWVKSPFTNKKLVVHNDGKFETYND